MNRLRVSSGTPWELKVGYSRAVRVDRFVYVSGTTATDESGSVIGVGDPYAQARQALEGVGAQIDDVVRTRMYVTDIEHWEDIGRAHAEFFAEIRPATAMVEVARLMSPEMLVEIEADAVMDL